MNLARESDTIFTLLDLPRDRFVFLCNSPGEAACLGARGFQSHVIPHNAWLDERRMRPVPTGKAYRAVYVARRAASERHHLAGLVDGLALVVGSNYGSPEVEVPPHAYLNTVPLTPVGVCLKINQALCGLVLSAVEGGCYASGEYLLCGLPVVSTPSEGGRDVWYTEYNAIIWDPAPEAVAAAVDRTLERGRDPATIRQAHIEQAIRYRQAFVSLLADILRYKLKESVLNGGGNPKQLKDAGITPDMRKRGAVRALFDGRYTFARYFSPKQYTTAPPRGSNSPPSTTSSSTTARPTRWR